GDMDSLFQHWLSQRPKKVLQNWKKFEAEKLGHFVSRSFYPGLRKGFVFKNGPDQYVVLAQADFLREVYHCGLGYELPLRYTPKSKKEESTKEKRSQLTSALLSEVYRSNQIDWYGKLAGYRAGLHNINGTKLLITESPKFVEAKESDWTFIRNFTYSLLRD